MNNSAILHIILTVSGIAILYTLVHPMYLDSLDINESISEVKLALEDAAAANQELQTKANEYQAISDTNRERLDMYLATEIDELRVLSNVLSIANTAGVRITDYGAEKAGSAEVETEYLGSDEELTGSIAGQKGLRLNIDVTGEYDPIKQFLSLTKLNEYPIIIEALTVGSAAENDTASEGGDARDEAELSQVSATSVSLQLYVPEFSPRSTPTNQVADPELDPTLDPNNTELY